MSRLVKRSEKIPFYGVSGDSGVITYHRMTGFTTAAVNKNPSEYTRQYVDEDFERSDVVGYSPVIEYMFDMYTENPVHLDIAEIADREHLGSDAVRSIVTVDFSKPENGGYFAVRRKFSVIPDGEGEASGAYQYSGTMKAAGEKEFGTAKSDDDGKTVVFAPGN